MGREQTITRAIRRYDRDLYAKVVHGRIDIMRRTARYESYNIDASTRLLFARPIEQLIFSLTDNWNINGNPVEWGILPILARLKAIDCWNRGDFLQELESAYERCEMSEKRNLKNNTEGFLMEFHSAFRNTFKDINTSTLNKIDRRRIKDGYYK
jgi:hypothetical protein